MTKAQGESNSKLLSATVSCITAIWTVFGMDKFGDDTQQVIFNTVNVDAAFG